MVITTITAMATLGCLAKTHRSVVEKISINHPALRTAVNLYRQPSLARSLEKKGLPQGMAELLGVVSTADDSSQLADELGSSPSELRAACILFLQTVVFYQGASDSRLLALPENFNSAQLRDHKRLLLKWLHPDRNHNSWESKLFLRVQSAASRLQSQAKDEGGKTINQALVSPTNALFHHKNIHSLKRQRPSHLWGNIFKAGLVKLSLMIVVFAVIFYVMTAAWNDGRVVVQFYEAGN